jgi:predicted site-specific integrase-resolvase
MPKINPQKINKHMTYEIKEICRDLGVVQKTCYRWIKEGLPIVPKRVYPRKEKSKES